MSEAQLVEQLDASLSKLHPTDLSMLREPKEMGFSLLLVGVGADMVGQYEIQNDHEIMSKGVDDSLAYGTLVLSLPSQMSRADKTPNCVTRLGVAGGNVHEVAEALVIVVTSAEGLGARQSGSMCVFGSVRPP